MSTSPKPPPRFVPTLTEVVDPSSLGRLTPSLQPDVQAVVSLVLRQIQPIFEQRLQEELDRLVHTVLAEQWADFHLKLEDEMTMFVNQAVMDALSEQKKGKIKK